MTLLNLFLPFRFSSFLLFFTSSVLGPRVTLNHYGTLISSSYSLNHLLFVNFDLFTCNTGAGGD